MAQQVVVSSKGKAVAAVVNEQGEVFKDTVVVREGEKIVLPDGMSCRQGIEVLTQREREEETKVGVNIVVDAYPLEGARAFQLALAEKFGWVGAVPTPGFFGDSPPTMLAIETGIDKTEEVIWGRVQIPAIDGHLATSLTVLDGRFLFAIGGEVKRKSLPLVTALGDLTKRFVKERSIYKGHALRVEFTDPMDENFDPRNGPKFMDTTKTRSEDLIFSRDIDARIRRALFNPIEHTQACRDHGIPLKRGTLLAGTFGVGKSLAAAVTAKKCVEHGWTFLYLSDPDQLATAIRFARAYEPAVVFVEDVDKVTGGERDAELDEILNAIDGVDTKNSEVMLVFTTNRLDIINRAALRAGRLDDIVEVLPPDPEAVERLINLYTRGMLANGERVGDVAAMLAGQIPATICDVCTRAQLAAVPRATRGNKLTITAEDLRVAALGKLDELKLVNAAPPREFGTSVERAADILGTKLAEAFVVAGEDTKKKPNGDVPPHRRTTAPSA